MNNTIEAKFTNEMLEILKMMKGKTLKAFQGDFANGMNRVYGFFRIILGQFAVDVDCSEHPVTLVGYDNEESVEDFAYFGCYKKNLKDSFEPFYIPHTVSFLLNEVVSEIMIVRDDIQVSNGAHIVLDQAFVIKTNENTYTISRKEWFVEQMNIDVSDSIKVARTVKDVKNEWSSEGKYRVDVERQYIFL